MVEETEIESKVSEQLRATEQIVKALSPLDVDARSLVIEHACQLLNISLGMVNTKPLGQTFISPVMSSVANPIATSPTGIITDIRTLKATKLPKSDNEMACLVAYYLKELAPQSERKEEISKDEIEKYFNQAGFELPKALRMVLPSAKKAGYFDSTSAGLYKLNPVGFNLAAYGLPSNGTSAKKVNRAVGKRGSILRSGKNKKSQR